MKKMVLQVLMLICPVLLAGEFGTWSGLAPEFVGTVKQSHYVTMSDGVKIALDLYLPAGSRENRRLPAIVEQTRYWRAAEDRKGNNPVPDTVTFFTDRGYVVAMVDVRGSGASFGNRPHPYSEREIADGKEIVDWLTGQPWSNGKVGSFGVSYTANTSALLATHGHPAHKIAIARFYDFDVFEELLWPGGIFNERMVREWGTMVTALDRNKTVGVGVAPVSGSEHLLKDAIAQHDTNLDVYAAARQIDYRDQVWDGAKATIDGFSLHTRIEALNASGAYLYLWGSWMDAGTARGVLRHLKAGNLKTRAVIGPWSHGGNHHASPFIDPGTYTTPAVSAQYAEMAKAFDNFLKNKLNDFPGGPLITYYTMGEERWRTTDVWPPEGLTRRHWHFSAEHRLALKPSEDEGMDEYKVDFEASTGLTNRWNTQLGGDDVIYPDRAAQDARLLTYTSEPLEQSLEITGTPTAYFVMTNTEKDGAVYAYLEDVAPDGRVTYITEGHLRLIHRKISGVESGIPVHSYLEQDAAPMVPGQKTKIALALLPTSTVVRKGHRLRIAFAGHDKDTFARYPKRGEPVWRIFHGKKEDAGVSLPVKVRLDLDEKPDSATLAAFSGTYHGSDGAEVTVEIQNGLLVCRPGNQAGMRLVFPETMMDNISMDTFRDLTDELIGAFRKKDRKKAESMLMDSAALHKALFDSSKQLAKSKGHRHRVQWLARGTVRILVDIESKKGTSPMLFVYSPATKKLYWFYNGYPLPEKRFQFHNQSTFGAFGESGQTIRFHSSAGKVAGLSLNGTQLEKR